LHKPEYTIVTDPFEEEFFISTIFRNNELCGINKSEWRHRELSGFEIAKLDYTPSEAFGGLFDNETVYKHTLHPIGALFDRIRYKNMTFTPRENLRICIQCVMDDTDNLGTAYIHRTHVAPGALGTLVCHLHAVALSNICPICQLDLMHHKLTNLSACVNRKSNIKTESLLGSTTHQYSQFVYATLKKTGLTEHRRYSTQTIDQSLKKLGYSSPSIDSYFQFCIDADNKTGTPREVYNTVQKSNHNLARTPMQLFTRVAYLLYDNLDNFIDEIEEFRSIKT